MGALDHIQHAHAWHLGPLSLWKVAATPASRYAHLKEIVGPGNNQYRIAEELLGLQGGAQDKRAASRWG